MYLKISPRPKSLPSYHRSNSPNPNRKDDNKQCKVSPYPYIPCDIHTEPFLPQVFGLAIVGTGYKVL